MEEKLIWGGKEQRRQQKRGEGLGVKWERQNVREKNRRRSGPQRIERLGRQAEGCRLTLALPADHLELHAQVPTALPHRASQRHPEAALQHVPHLRVPRDRLHRGHRLPERQGARVGRPPTIHSHPPAAPCTSAPPHPPRRHPHGRLPGPQSL